jgi:hypothetical protein
VNLSLQRVYRYSPVCESNRTVSPVWSSYMHTLGRITVTVKPQVVVPPCGLVADTVTSNFCRKRKGEVITVLPVLHTGVSGPHRCCAGGEAGQGGRPTALQSACSALHC